MYKAGYEMCVLVERQLHLLVAQTYKYFMWIVIILA